MQKSINFKIKLPENPKIWLTLVTQDKEESVDSMTRNIYNFFDGIIAVDGGSKDQTPIILNERKKAGAILYRKYDDNHDFQRNVIMTAGIMKTFDWMLLLDSEEQIQPEWCATLRDQVKYYQQNNIGVGMIGRPYFWEYYRDQVFWGNAHTWANPLRKLWINLDSSILIKKKMNHVHGLINPFKYFLYPRSNETQIMYARFGPEIVKRHEELRQQAILYWEFTMGRELSLKGIEDYFWEIYNDPNKIDEVWINYMEFEHRFADYFRLKILKQDFLKDIVPTRYTWSFREYFKNRDEKQLNSTFKSPTLLYCEQFGLDPYK